MNAIIALWVSHGTRVIGYLGATLGVLAVSTDVFSATTLKYIILANGLVTAWRGHMNAATIAKKDS